MTATEINKSSFYHLRSKRIAGRRHRSEVRGVQALVPFSFLAVIGQCNN